MYRKETVLVQKIWSELSEVKPSRITKIGEETRKK